MPKEVDCSGAPAIGEEHTLIIVGKDEGGHHCVCDNHGLMVDNFSTHEDAVCFAFAERARQPGAIVMITPAEIGH